MDSNTSPTQSKILGHERILNSKDVDATQHDNVKTTQSHHQLIDHQSDAENFDNYDDQLDEQEQSSEQSNDGPGKKSYLGQRITLASPKNSSSETNLDDRRLRRQIANCNERRRMQSINAGFQALRQFLPQRCGEKLSKAAILQQTAELIQSLQLGRRPADYKSTSDEEANAEDRPQCKKRRINIKTEPKNSVESESGHLETQISEYIKIIEELRSALNKEQQLRLLYEQKLIDLKTTLSASLGFSSMPTGINLDRNENVQTTTQPRSNSADGLSVPKITCDNSQVSAFIYNNASSLLNNQLRIGREPNNVLSALLSPTQQLNALHLNTSIPFAQQPVQNVMPLVNLLVASLQSPTINQPPGIVQNGISTSEPNTLYAIAEALRQIENDSKNFSNDSLPTDVLVR